MFGSIKSGLYKKLRRIVESELRKVESRLPYIELGQRYFEKIKVLNNRETLLQELPKNGIVAELGVDQGEFSQKIVEISNPRKLHLVDSWGTQRYHNGLKGVVESRFSKQIEAGSILIHQGFSTDYASSFPDQYFDWIYIDTDHTYETTKEELLLYRDKMKPGGIIAGHDFVKGNIIKQLRYGVMEAVYEFCLLNNWEFIYLTMELNNNPSFAIRKISSNV